MFTENVIPQTQNKTSVFIARLQDREGITNDAKKQTHTKDNLHNTTMKDEVVTERTRRMFTNNEGRIMKADEVNELAESIMNDCENPDDTVNETIILTLKEGGSYTFPAAFKDENGNFTLLAADDDEGDEEYMIMNANSLESPSETRFKKSEIKGIEWG